MLANEAFEVLALRADATPLQIKEAYRDLVKVWHPDRFGSDPRLRRKAEEKLQQINVAYRVLQSGRDGGVGYGVAATPVYSSSAPSASASIKRRGGPSRVALRWFYGWVVISLVVFAGYMVLEYRASQSREAADAQEQLVANSSIQKVGGGIVAGHAHPTGTSVQAGAAGDSKRRDGAPFAVRSLTEDETARLDEACEPQRERLGQEAYQVCMAAQVGLLTNPAGLPYLGALNAAERESIKSACAEARRASGVDGYDRCLTIKMAEWAAEAARPQLANLNEMDRSSVEAACRGAKEREGPAAYDRCLVRFMKAMAESR